MKAEPWASAELMMILEEGDCGVVRGSWLCHAVFFSLLIVFFFHVFALKSLTTGIHSEQPEFGSDLKTKRLKLDEDLTVCLRADG